MIALQNYYQLREMECF